jgi:hypothetical protein
MPTKLTTLGPDLALIELQGALMAQQEIEGLRNTITTVTSPESIT